MKKTIILKIAAIISFLIIVFPGPHVVLVNFIVIPLILFDNVTSIWIDTIDFDTIKNIILSSLTLLSLIVIFKKNKYFVLACFIVQYLWLCNTFNNQNLSSSYYLTTVGLYFIVSLILLLNTLLVNIKQSLV